MRIGAFQSRSLIIGSVGALVVACCAGGCGTTARDTAMKRRSMTYTAMPGDGRLSVAPTGQPERVGTGRRSARDISNR
jgi:hypothetical protein